MLSWFEHLWDTHLWFRGAVGISIVAVVLWLITSIARWIDYRIRYRQMVAEAVAKDQQATLRRTQERVQMIADQARVTRKARKKPKPSPPPAPPPPAVASTAWERILCDDADEKESPPCPMNVTPETEATTKPARLVGNPPKRRAPRKLKI